MSRDMVEAYVERLLEELSGVEKLARDPQGGFPFRTDKGAYTVRVEGTDKSPAVRVFAVALADVEPTPALYEDLNGVNSRLVHARCFWADRLVVFEDAIPGLSLNEGNLRATLAEVAQASGFFATALHEKHGGRLTVEEEVAPPAEAAAGDDEGSGVYL